MKFPLGLVIGKFYPPHSGHRFLIETALERSDRVVVFVCERPTDTIPGALRATWLKEMTPPAEVRVIDDRYDENDVRIWAENTLRWLGQAPDAVFTSEDYGDRYAALMGSRHICVDKPRVNRPISGTAVRNDPFSNWDLIDPPLRGWFAKRVCVLGAESTGTTTLARSLAEYYGTIWVAEYGREYSEIKMLANEGVWRTSEFVDIAREQARREDAAARDSNRLLICDTNAFAPFGIGATWVRRVPRSAGASDAPVVLPADLTLLLNPASEAITARRLKLALVNWKQPTPAIISVTSIGDTDTATFWSIGMKAALFTKTHSFRTYGDGSHQQDYITSTAGHSPILIDRQITRLDPQPIPPVEDATRWNFQNATTAQFRSANTWWRIEDAPPSQAPFVMNGDQARGYWVMSAPKEIIRDHNDIFNPSAVDLFAALFKICQPTIRKSPAQKAISVPSTVAETAGVRLSVAALVRASMASDVQAPRTDPAAAGRSLHRKRLGLNFDACTPWRGLP